MGWTNDLFPRFSPTIVSLGNAPGFFGMTIAFWAERVATKRGHSRLIF